MRVRCRLTKARHAAISSEVVEWSEQLRPVTSVRLGAVRRSVQVRLCTSGCKSEKMFGVISPPRDLLPSIIIIVMIITIIIMIIIIIIKIIVIIIEGSKSRGVDVTPNIFSLLHPLVRSQT